MPKKGIMKFDLFDSRFGKRDVIRTFFYRRKRNLSDLWFQIRWQYVERFTDKDPHMVFFGHPELTHNGPEDGVY